ncbi:hypothetical protein [Sediminihaliea albiluteola]|uniref:hypothetical protein n=1 Tax=Sediminihaliea albiluteola TaxID=2758564 RepID=UPI0015F6E257|nr:hypothetical protein [Sediminihaliea albiluteola]
MRLVDPYAKPQSKRTLLGNKLSQWLQFFQKSPSWPEDLICLPVFNEFGEELGFDIVRSSYEATRPHEFLKMPDCTLTRMAGIYSKL